MLDALAATTSLRREWSKIFEDDPPLLDAIRRSPRLRLALFAGARESKGLKPPIAALVVAFRDARPGGRRSTNETQRLNRLALRNFVLGEVEDIDPRGIEELVSKRRRGVFSAPTIEDVSLTFRHYLVAQHLVAQLRRGDDSLLVRYSIPERFVLQFARAIDPELASRFSEDRLASVRQDVARTVEREVNLTLAHQLNRAVGSLYSHVKQLRKAIGDAATLHAAESLSGIDAELRFLKRLTDQSNRLDRSHEWTLRSLELAPIIDAAIQSLQLEADKRSWIHVDVHDSHRARADEDGLREVLFCLLENAIHAVSYQTVDAAHRAVAVEVMRVDETIEIRVRDRGCGIVDEDRDRVFEPFVTTKKGGEGKPRGSGLGLTIARRYAERMNGRLVLERAHGETVFLLRLVAGE
ncbi:MAG: sensor histidine kinase [Myxococcales bacterium]|nr:sensor histidine kinase [Myxococcales bacterium]